MKIILCLLLLATLNVSRLRADPEWLHFAGMCDASAVEMLDEDLFVAGNDEDNVLRVYSRSRQGPPVQTIDFTTFFALPKRTMEMDLEGAARIGNRIYWISSHGANSKGKPQPSRHRLFATEVLTTNGVSQLRMTGRLYTSLVRDLAAQPDFAALNLLAASRKAPKAAGALNIEGLAPTPEGHLLIGFRNPLPEGRAMLVRLRNPAGVITGARPEFAPPQYVELGGMGIRSITPYKGGYLIVAGPFDSEGGASRLHFWDGVGEKAKLLPTPLAGNPEGIAVIERPRSDLLFAISDDGTVENGGIPCKKLKDNSLKIFRAFQTQIPKVEIGASFKK